MDNEKPTGFREVTKFPSVRRDLALVLDITVRFEDISKIAYAVEPGLLSAINLFDVYQGDKIPQGKKSYAISFVLLDSEKTLTDKVIDHVMNRLIKQFEEKLGAVLR
jgi:phenylalanyl-tRNA synthetase beta chain